MAFCNLLPKESGLLITSCPFSHPHLELRCSYPSEDQYPLLGGKFIYKTQVIYAESVTPSIKSLSHCICTSVYCMIFLVCLPSPLHNAWHITLLNKCLNKARMQGDRKRGKRKEVREEGRRKLAFPGHSSFGRHRAVSRKKWEVLSIWLASLAETMV